MLVTLIIIITKFLGKAENSFATSSCMILVKSVTSQVLGFLTCKLDVLRTAN